MKSICESESEYPKRGGEVAFVGTTDSDEVSLGRPGGEGGQGGRKMEHKEKDWNRERAASQLGRLQSSASFG